MATVLLIDAHPRFAARAVSLLAVRGHHAIVAPTAAAADARVREKPAPELVLVDELFPDTTAEAWIEGLRRGGFSIPVILVLRAKPGVEPPRQFLSKMGVALVLNKPLEDEQLCDGVDAVLTRTALSRPRRTLSAMQASYGASLPNRLRELASVLQELKEGDTEGASFEEASVIAHRLHGTAGAFGFLVVGESAAHIEEQLPRIRDADPTTRGEAWGAIDAALADAERSLLGEASPAVLPLPSASERPHRAATTSSESRIEVAAAVTATATTEVLLLVDDDPSFREYVETLGRRKLLHVLSASTVSEALAVAREHKPQAALIDIQLGPSEHSFDLARELPAIPGCEKMRCAFISASTSIANRVDAAKAGAALYLAKPIDSTAFDLAMQQLFAFYDQGTPRLVLLDPVAESRERTLGLMRACGWRIRAVETPGALLDALDEEKPDLILAMATADGFDACRALRTSLRWQDLPTVFLSDSEESAERFAAFDAGADDYIVRPLPSKELVMRLRARMNGVRLSREVAGRDRLTGLFLRGAFLDLLAARVSEAQRHSLPLSIALIDLDHFKKVNDTHGHLAGDQVLLALGRLLAGRLRGEDLRARWGGEEFIVAFPGETSGTAYLMFTRILAEFSRLAFRGAGSESFGVTFSAGIASLGEDGGDLEALLGVADRRLYAAKKRGRNRIAFRG